jgi:transcriptional regulator with XRE-family HTH domain
MISLPDHLRVWRSRYRLSKEEAAKAHGQTAGMIDQLERGTQILRGQAREALIKKLSEPPGTGIRGAPPDAGFRPGA